MFYADRSQVIQQQPSARQEEQAAQQAEKELQARSPKVPQKRSGLSYKKKN